MKFISSDPILLDPILEWEKSPGKDPARGSPRVAFPRGDPIVLWNMTNNNRPQWVALLCLLGEYQFIVGGDAQQIALTIMLNGQMTFTA